MEVILLGTGSSMGVPALGMAMADRSQRPYRTRSSLLVRTLRSTVLIDTSPDLRTQGLRIGLDRINAVCYTHAHADHVHGIDDLRPLAISSRLSIPIWGDRKTIDQLTSRFSYLFENSTNRGLPTFLTPNVITGPFQIDDLVVQPFDIFHGDELILGFRLHNVAYLIDCSGVSLSSKLALRDLELLIIGALREEPHPKHFSITQALSLIDELQPTRAVLTNISYQLNTHRFAGALPRHVALGYDGQLFTL